MAFNGLIQTIFVGKKFHTTVERNLNSMVYIFVMEFLNTGILVLIYKFSWPFEIERFAKILILALGALCVTSNIFDLVRYLLQ